MQHVNDDMDELFRRAAEGYPLNTDSADWNAVIKKLESERAAPVKKETRNKNYKHLLWLLLLLPLGLYKSYIINNNGPSNAVSKNGINKNLPGVSLKNISPQINTIKPVTVAPQKPLVFLSPSVTKRNTKEKLYSKISENNSFAFVQDKTQVLTTDPHSEATQKKEKEFVSEQDSITENKRETGAIKLDTDNKEDDAVKNVEEKTKNEKKKISIQKQRGFYAGIVVGPDMSTVKFQSIKSIGIGMGLLVGYQINNRISLESGIAWDIKNYYSDGKYFNTKNLPSNYNAKIENVDGVCNMIEVPIAIKYNITKGKTHFSITAGSSSYFMKKEKYDYQVANNGQQYQYSSTYKNASTNFLAVANFAVGYSKTLKKNISLRLEPYIKIPLKGIGFGSLPIMSTGLNIGVTKKLSR